MTKPQGQVETANGAHLQVEIENGTSSIFSGEGQQQLARLKNKPRAMEVRQSRISWRHEPRSATTYMSFFEFELSSSRTAELVGV